MTEDDGVEEESSIETPMVAAGYQRSRDNAPSRALTNIASDLSVWQRIIFLSLLQLQRDSLRVPFVIFAVGTRDELIEQLHATNKMVRLSST